MHYRRWRLHGDPMTVFPHGWRGTPEERFWSKVDKDGPVPSYRPELGPCWVWTGYRDDLGYGRFGDEGGQSIPAYRWGYRRYVGPIPKGRELDHLCRNPSCVRFDHLEPVTHAENLRRGLLARQQAS